MNRREFMKLSAAAAATLPAAGVVARTDAASSETASQPAATPNLNRSCHGIYEGPSLSRVAFPLGGLGAGMICIEGTG